MTDTRFRGGAVLAATILSMAAFSAQAQSRVEVGYVYIDGRNDAGAMTMEAGHHADWRTVDRGSGAALRFRHDWQDWPGFYVIADYQRLNLASRYSKGYWDCASPTSPPPLSENPCFVVPERFNYDERYHDYGLSLGWRYQANTRLAPWGELGVNHERRATSGGIVYRMDSDPPLTGGIMPVSDSETALRAAAGLDVALAENTDLTLGLSFRNKAYRSAVHSYPIAGDPRPISSSYLLEGVTRMQHGFGEHWLGYVEYRPSTKRQYFQAGIGYRF
ncbi:MAG: porin family protein [Xanthomonadales bacterium]|nr:porin family protein [Xanthomonadales bacterium]